MTIAAIVVGVLLAIVVGHYADAAGRRSADRVLAWWRRRHEVEECPLCDGGRGRELSARCAHVFRETWLEEQASGLSTGVAVAYCAEHCPGGCTNPKCRRIPG